VVQLDDIEFIFAEPTILAENRGCLIRAPTTGELPKEPT